MGKNLEDAIIISLWRDVRKHGDGLTQYWFNGWVLFFDHKETVEQVLEHLSEWLCFLSQHCGAASTKGSRQQMVRLHVNSPGHYSSRKAWVSSRIYKTAPDGFLMAFYCHFSFKKQPLLEMVKHETSLNSFMCRPEGMLAAKMALISLFLAMKASWQHG